MYLFSNNTIVLLINTMENIWNFHVKRRGFVTENGSFDDSLLWRLLFWKLKLETEGEAEAEGSFYAQLQKYLEISCKKTRIRDRKWLL